jgi:hypothetical protein
MFILKFMTFGGKQMAKNKKIWGYNVNDPFDREMVLDLPFSMQNKRGRKAKKKTLKK